MNKTAETLRQQKPTSVLAGLGIKISRQRVVILQYLLEHDTHPSVDEIYGDLLRDIPELSRTTVYNTLKLFTAAGLVEELTMDGNESHYDLLDASHSHFKCRGCGRIFDIAVPSMSVVDGSVPAGFLVEEHHLYLKGLCPSCAGYTTSNKEQ